MKPSGETIMPSITEVALIGVEFLQPHPKNPNKMPPAMFEKLKKNIERWGVYKPVRVRRIPNQSDYQILGGHQTVEACKELEINEIPCVVLDLDDYQAMNLMLNDNEIKGEHDPVAQARALQAMLEHRALEQVANDTIHTKEKIQAFLDLENKQRQRAVAFTAGKEKSNVYAVEAAYAGEDATFIKGVFARLGGKQTDALLKLCQEYWKKVE